MVHATLVANECPAHTLAQVCRGQKVPFSVPSLSVPLRGEPQSVTPAHPAGEKPVSGRSAAPVLHYFLVVEVFPCEFANEDRLALVVEQFAVIGDRL